MFQKNVNMTFMTISRYDPSFYQGFSELAEPLKAYKIPHIAFNYLPSGDGQT